jgi:hypothetical protein
VRFLIGERRVRREGRRGYERKRKQNDGGRNPRRREGWNLVKTSKLTSGSLLHADFLLLIWNRASKGSLKRRAYNISHRAHINNNATEMQEQTVKLFESFLSSSQRA